MVRLTSPETASIAEVNVKFQQETRLPRQPRQFLPMSDKETINTASLIYWSIAERIRFISPASRSRGTGIEFSLLRAKDSAPCAVLL